jgi:virginiamycin B lyase
MEVASDPHGTIWSTTFNTSTLLKFDPTSASFTPYLAPDPAKSSQALSGGLYGLTITASGAIWVTVTAANVVAHFDTTRHHFDYYSVPTQGSLPLGIVAGTDHSCWFTEAMGNKLGELTL